MSEKRGVLVVPEVRSFQHTNQGGNMINLNTAANIVTAVCAVLIAIKLY